MWRVMHPRIRSFLNTRRLALGVLFLALLILAYVIFGTGSFPRAQLEAHVERCLRAGRDEDALSLADKLASHDPASATPPFLRARALFALGRDRECDEALD